MTTDAGKYGHLQETRPFALVKKGPTVGLYRDASLKHKIMDVSFDTRLPEVGRTGKAIRVAVPGGSAYLSSDDAKVYKKASDIPYPTGEDLVETGKIFLGAPICGVAPPGTPLTAPASPTPSTTPTASPSAATRAPKHTLPATESPSSVRTFRRATSSSTRRISPMRRPSTMSPCLRATATCWRRMLRGRRPASPLCASTMTTGALSGSCTTRISEMVTGTWTAVLGRIVRC